MSNTAIFFALKMNPNLGFLGFSAVQFSFATAIAEITTITPSGNTAIRETAAVVLMDTAKRLFTLYV